MFHIPPVLRGDYYLLLRATFPSEQVPQLVLYAMDTISPSPTIKHNAVSLPPPSKERGGWVGKMHRLADALGHLVCCLSPRSLAGTTYDA